MKNFLLLLLVLILPLNMYAQEKAWFYLRATDTLILPKFKEVKNQLVYTGNDPALKSVLDAYTIYEFKKTYKHASRDNLKKTFFVMANDEKLLSDLLRRASHVFVSGDLVSEADKKIYEPNDYGLTSTIGENIGLQVNLDYLDVLGLPKAWYYTTGNPETIIGISDGSLDTLNQDFKGKSKQIRRSNLAKGHGIGISANAGAQGDNGYGIPGVCYDCGLYGTSYGDFTAYKSQKELAALGVKVINCSWVGRKYYESGEKAVNELFDNGTIIVAAGGNSKWENTKGELSMYPASFKNVISVSSVMHKWATVEEGTGITQAGKPYFANVRGYVGRTGGFVDHDKSKAKRIYPISIRTLNPEVDILAPTVDIIRFADYVLHDEIKYNAFSTTSGAAPFVSGTVGLMLSLAPCFPIDQIEGVIKLTATNINHIKANKPYAGNYGAGMLHTGRAVEMVYNMFSPKGNVRIENQQFSRWDFKMTSYSDVVTIQNQEFTESAKLDVVAKNRIVIRQNTVLRPNDSGAIKLRINPELEAPCDMVLRDPSIEN